MKTENTNSQEVLRGLRIRSWEEPAILQSWIQMVADAAANLPEKKTRTIFCILSRKIWP